MGVRQALNAAEIPHPDVVAPVVDAATFVDADVVDGDVDFAFAFVVVVVALAVEGVPVCSVLDRLPSVCWHFVGDLEYLIAVEYLTGAVGLVELVVVDALAVYDDYIVVAFAETRYSMQIALTHCLLQLADLINKITLYFIFMHFITQMQTSKSNGRPHELTSPNGN